MAFDPESNNQSGRYDQYDTNLTEVAKEAENFREQVSALIRQYGENNPTSVGLSGIEIFDIWLPTAKVLASEEEGCGGVMQPRLEMHGKFINGRPVERLYGFDFDAAGKLTAGFQYTYCPDQSGGLNPKSDHRLVSGEAEEWQRICQYNPGMINEQSSDLHGPVDQRDLTGLELVFQRLRSLI